MAFLSHLSWSNHYVSCCGYLLGGPGSYLSVGIRLDWPLPLRALGLSDTCRYVVAIEVESSPILCLDWGLGFCSLAFAC